MRNFMFPLLENQGPGSGGGKEGSDDLETDLDILSEDESEKKGEEEEDDEDEEDKKEKEDEDEEEEDEPPILDDLDDEEDEEKESGRKKTPKEDEEEDEEEEVEAEPERDERGRPTVKAIKSKYPDVFKDFPELKRSYFALPRYEEVFADPDQAQEAAEKAREFDELETSIVGKSDPTNLIKTLAENNPRSLTKFISNFPAVVKEHYNEAYVNLARPILEELVYTAFQHGTKVGDKNLVLSARHMANFVWSNGGEIPDVSKRAKAEPTEAEKELEVERNKTARSLFVTAVRDVMPKAESSLTGFLTQNLKGLTRFERNAILAETIRQTNGKLGNDKGFQVSISRLWDRAKAEEYSDTSKKRVLDAWLSRARQVALPIRNKLREEALGARSDRGDRSERREEGKKRTFPAQGGRDIRGKGPKVLDPSKIDWSKTSDLDILNSK